MAAGEDRLGERRAGPRARLGAAIVLATWLLGLLTCPVAAGAGPRMAYGTPPRVSADAAVLLDPVTGRLLYERQAFRTLPPASTTKVMTCLLALEACALDEVVRVSPRAAATGGSRVGLEAGQLIALEDLLFGLMLRSGNDAAVAIAEHVAGSVERFVALMNARARALGALATSFRNPHGLSAAGHLSTAYDLALMVRAALRDERFGALVRSREHEIGSLTPAWTRLLLSTNRLLWSYEGADGVKTGTTAAAGQCLVASATRGGRQLIAVVLHSDDRWEDAARLLSYGFDRTRLHLLALPGEPARTVEALDPVPIPAAGPALAPPRRVRLTLVTREALAFNAPAGWTAPLEVVFSTDQSPPLLPLRAGQEAGRVVVYAGGEIVASAGLTAAVSVPRRPELARLVAAVSSAVGLYLRQGLR